MKIKWRYFLPFLWVILINVIILSINVFNSNDKLYATTVDGRNLSNQVTDIEVKTVDDQENNFYNNDLLLIKIKFASNQAVEPGDFIKVGFDQYDSDIAIKPLEKCGNLIANNQKVGKFELSDNVGKLIFQRITCFNKGCFTFAAVVKNFSGEDRNLYLQAGKIKKRAMIKSKSVDNTIQKIGRIEGDKIYWTTLINFPASNKNPKFLIEETLLGHQYLNPRSVEIKRMGNDIKVDQIIRPQVQVDNNSFNFIVKASKENEQYQVAYCSSIDLMEKIRINYSSKTKVMSAGEQEINSKVGHGYLPLTLADQVQFKENDQLLDLKKTDKDEFLSMLFKYFEEHLDQTKSDKQTPKQDDKSKPTLKLDKTYALPSFNKLTTLSKETESPTRSNATEVLLKSKLNLNRVNKNLKEVEDDKNVVPKSLDKKSYSNHYGYNRSHRNNSWKGDNNWHSSRCSRNHDNSSELPQAGFKNEIWFCLLGCVCLTSGLLIHYFHKKVN